MFSDMNFKFVGYPFSERTVRGKIWAKSLNYKLVDNLIPNLP